MPATRRRPRPSIPVLAALTVLLALLATACGGVGGGDSGSGDGSSKLTTSGFGLGDAIAKVRVARFKQQNPDVDLKVNEGAFDPQTFLSAVASNDPPDLVYMDREVLGTYAGRGALQPLDSCVRTSGIKLSDFRQPAVDQLRLGGKLYGIPEFYDVRVLLADTDALKQSGLSVSDVSTADWSALPGLERRLTRRHGGKLSRIGFDPKLPEFLPLWAKANGVDLLSEDGRTAHLDDPKVVQALTMATSLIRQTGGWGTFKSFRDTWDFFGDKNQYATDQVGVSPMEDWYLSVLAGVSPDAPVAAVPFQARDGSPVTFATGNAWAIPKGAANPDDACTFIKTMTEKAAWVAAARAAAKQDAADGKPYTGTFTGNRAADKVIFSDVWKPSGNKGLDDAVRTVLDAQSSAFTTPASAASSEVKDAWFGAVNDVLAGKTSPAAALHKAQQKAQSALDEATK